MDLNYSFIIPVYNRPQEVKELLDSLLHQDYKKDFEVIIVEDGSTKTCEEVVNEVSADLKIQYFFKENTGAGLSRNYGMERASGNYFIVLDSDVLLPENYLSNVDDALANTFTDAFGGPDASHSSFNALQKAISYSMTSFLTTGGIRGKQHGVGKFQLRSFNLGVSKQAFEATNGFAELAYGEDIDLTFRLWNLGFKTQLIATAFVYHKRRNTISQFYHQTFNFGTARPLLNRKYPKTSKLTFWFPSLFILAFDFAILLAIFVDVKYLLPFGIYFTLIFLDSLMQNKNLKVAFLSIVTSYTQFLGYGLGFLKSTFKK